MSRAGHLERKSVARIAVVPLLLRLFAGLAYASAKARTYYEFHAFAGDTGDLRTIAFAPDGRTAVSGHWNSTAKIWNATTGKQLHLLSGHSGVVLSVAFCDGGATVLSGSADGTARLWNVTTGDLLQTFGLNSGFTVSVACATDAPTVLAGSSSGVANLWDGDSGKSLGPLEDEGSPVDGIVSVALSSDGTLAFTATQKNLAFIWNVASRRVLHTLRGHEAWVLAASFSADGNFVVTGSHDRTARLWRTSSGHLESTFKGHFGSVCAVAINRNGSRVLTGSHDSTARVWSRRKSKELQKFTRKGQVIAISFADKIVASSVAADGTDAAAALSFEEGGVGGSSTCSTDAHGVNVLDGTCRAERADGHTSGAGASEPTAVVVGWLRKRILEPDRTDRLECEANCAALEAEEKKKKEMPVFEI
eukprot:TRINITY_DN62045_c0_g1_i1.p1 TRINITY_DN62045_c0_g1~~TRINITY_DN62045_c0_g1_i1.p1  ORF type:complete len:420 (-),score=67.58 TRINITY_DN62045_c0_g1_i1:151-1410(-)